MPSANHERLLQFLQGELTPEEEIRLQRELARLPALRDELAALETLQQLLRTTFQASSARALKPFFADRVMRRLASAARRLPVPSPEEEVFSLLLRLFRPVAIAGALIILGFATYNVTLAGAYDTQPSTTEAVLGLPPVTLATAYDLDFGTILPTTDP